MPAPGNTPPQRKGWRQSSKSSTATSPTRPKAAGWTKRASDGEYESAVLRHRLRVVFWSLLFAGLIGGLPLLRFQARSCERRWWRLRPRTTRRRSPLTRGQRGPRRPAIAGQEGGLFEEKRIVDFRDVPAWESKDQWLREIRQANRYGPAGRSRRGTRSLSI